MPGQPVAAPVQYQCDVKGTVLLHGSLSADNWCWTEDACASVSAGVTLTTTGSMPVTTWGNSLLYRIDGAICEAQDHVAVGVERNDEGVVRASASWSWSGTAPWVYNHSSGFRRWWQCCGDPRGQSVRLIADFFGSAVGTASGNSSFSVEVKDASVSFSILSCDNCGGDGAGVPLHFGESVD